VKSVFMLCTIFVPWTRFLREIMFCVDVK
jgi:hypothetical protein